MEGRGAEDTNSPTRKILPALSEGQDRLHILLSSKMVPDRRRRNSATDATVDRGLFYLYPLALHLPTVDAQLIDCGGTSQQLDITRVKSRFVDVLIDH